MSEQPLTTPGFALVGTTATGKTQLALDFAKWIITTQPQKFSGVVLISADSKQIYQGLSILTGADVPTDFLLAHSQLSHPDPSLQAALSQYFRLDLASNQSIEIWGVSCLPPNLSWSAAQFQQFTRHIISLAAKKNQLVIVVGGTGLYQQIIWQTDPHVLVTPNPVIRHQAAKLNLDQLQDWLAKTNPQRYQSLNNSDKANPRRLIRHLELANLPISESGPGLVSVPTIGLERPLAELQTLIDLRVKHRLDQQVLTEVTQLELNNIDVGVTTILGFKELLALANDQFTSEQLIALWTKRELQYAKRQQTWWKKRQNITWLKSTQPEILTKLQTWFNKTQPVLPVLAVKVP